MTRKFKVGDVVRVKEAARKDNGAVECWDSETSWKGVVRRDCGRARWPYEVMFLNRALMMAARELDLVERPKEGAKR